MSIFFLSFLQTLIICSNDFVPFGPALHQRHVVVSSFVTATFCVSALRSEPPPLVRSGSVLVRFWSGSGPVQSGSGRVRFRSGPASGFNSVGVSSSKTRGAIQLSEVQSRSGIINFVREIRGIRNFDGSFSSSIDEPDPRLSANLSDSSVSGCSARLKVARARASG